MLLKIEALVVLIVGRISTGKMSFSHRLIDSNPLGGGMCVRYEGSAKPSKAKHKYQKAKSESIRKRAKDGLFTVVVCDQTSNNEIRDIISSLDLVPIQVIRFNLEDSVIESFLAKNHTKYGKKVILNDEKLYKEVQTMNFPNNVVSVVDVKNPQDIEKVEFEFSI